MSQTETGHHAPDADAINSTIKYTMYSVFAASRLPDDRDGLAEEFETFVAGLPGRGVELRGIYDLAGMRADADVLVWWHADTVDQLQAAYKDLLRTGFGRHLRGVWSNVGIHRPAEFNRGHVPAFMAGEAPLKYICLYPFVRSYDWYILPEQERRDLLIDHGKAARGYADVRANTVSAFALGDYEWLLSFEADDLHRIVDLMRDFRATEARRHVREEVPFFTGPRVAVRDLITALP
ncbi:hydrogen peroxide-dependent heme synthase [Kineosporia babensis]|uniref:Coproheme decarboxylase n=1 Tax=Kineosporia babensis TaxID=499548 RepID=A0A9X1NJE5_9ACTN|nr:hydrogen peroxide-dependent heme synthase [Kineosporia babensis]MCD5314223.1 chlorite dismutase family protein [Kineosporia babensis]